MDDISGMGMGYVGGFCDVENVGGIGNIGDIGDISDIDSMDDIGAVVT
jgi:hypothetical protein